MCGIFAVFGTPGSFTPQTLERGTAALHHRGPDSRRHWISQDRRVGLGHTRLSIIDLDGGQQPLSNEDSSIHAVINGEIYDFERIRKELQAKGHRLATRSDSEVLIHLYEDLGLDALHQLRGEFAFVLWDAKSQRLIAGRDRFGIKPLFFAKHEGALYFASEAKALFAAGVPAAWDEESLFQASGIGGPLPGRSLFRGITPIAPGHVMIARGNDIKMLQYWDFNYPKQAATGSARQNDQETIEEFRHLFEEAVRLRLHADVPVGVYLSGGLDSCSILGTAAKLRGHGIKAFNLSFEDADYDEEQLARDMAQQAGADYHSVKVTPSHIAQNFVSTIRQGETVILNSHVVAKYMLSEAVRDAGFKVVLTGEGSDEILAGYPHFRRDLLLYSQDHGQGEHVDQAMAMLQSNNAVSRGFLLTEGVADSVDNAMIRRLGFVPSWFEGQLNSMATSRAYMSAEALQELQGYDPYSWLLNEFDGPSQLKGRHPLNQSLYLWSKTSLPNYLLTILGDRMEMGHSVEGRVPFLDHHLVEFATKLPIDLKIRNMTEKYILREAARPVLTRAIYERQKHPFMAPPTDGAKKDPLFAFLREYIGDNGRSLGIFDSKKVQALLQNFETMSPGERQAANPILLMIASTAVLQNEFHL